MGVQALMLLDCLLLRPESRLVLPSGNAGVRKAFLTTALSALLFRMVFLRQDLLPAWLLVLSVEACKQTEFLDSPFQKEVTFLRTPALVSDGVFALRVRKG